MTDDRADTHDAYLAGPDRIRADVRAARGGVDVERLVLGAYTEYQRALYAFARSLVRDAHAAEDLVADAFLRLLREAAAGRPPERVRPWLFRVVANQVVNEGRRRAVAARVVGRLLHRGIVEPADAALLRDESDATVRQALLALPPDTRAALLLAAQGFSGREVAASIGRSESATRTLMCRGRIRLRELMEGQGVES